MPSIAASCVMLATLQNAPAGAPDTTGARPIAQLESVWNDAHLRANADALERLSVDRLVVIVPGMKPMTGSDAFAVLRTGRMTFERYATSDVEICTYGGTAIVTGRLQRTRRINDRPAVDDWRFTKVYVRSGDTWQVAAFHASVTPPE